MIRWCGSVCAKSSALSALAFRIKHMSTGKCTGEYGKEVRECERGIRMD